MGSALIFLKVSQVYDLENIDVFYAGATYNELECIGYFERVAKYLGWEKFSFLGHSMGGNFGCLYASVFPEKLKVIIQEV